MSGATDKVVSGWGVDGITTLQRGFPVKIADSVGNALTALGLGTGGLRPNVVPGCDKNTSGSVLITARHNIGSKAARAQAQSCKRVADAIGDFHREASL